MMAQQNPYAQYQSSRILTAKPGELVLMLYEGVIKFCNQAIIAIEKKDIQQAHDNIMKAERIIDHLLATLDRKYPVAEEFDILYDGFFKALVQANMKKDPLLLQEIIENMRLVRDNWKEVMKRAEKGANE